MKPYYQDASVTIFHGDCRDLLPTLDKVNLVFTSPPYNLGGSSGSEHSRLADGYASYSDDLPLQEYVAWQKEILTALWNNLTDTGAIFYNHKPIAKGNEVRLPLELNPGLPLRQIITWDRTKGFQRTYWHFVPRYEWILVFAKPEFRITNLSTFDIWRLQSDINNEHPASFPIGLPRRAIASTDAQTILDPFMGSGTTLRAAKDLNRKAIGVEIAAKRMSQLAMELN